MAKKIRCPECGHSHTVSTRAQVAGLRAKKLTSKQFEYSAIIPEYLSFDDPEEIERLLTISEQALLVGLIGLGAGSLVGFWASQPFPIEYCFQIIPSCALIGFTLAEAFLAAERFYVLGKVLPWFARQRTKLNTSTIAGAGEVTLTVDHRHRDSQIESGRTINRFGALPVGIEKFNEWTQAALVGKSLAVSKWTGNGKLFSRSEYDALLAKLVAGGIITNLGSNKGNTLTSGGRRSLTRHLTECGITPPSPASASKVNDFLGERFAQARANHGGNTPLPRSGVRAGGENGG